MRLIYISILLIVVAGCKANGESPTPDATETTSEPHPFSDGELNVGFADGGGGGGTNGGDDTVDPCYFTGPDEAVVLVEFDEPPQIVDVSRECGDADPYRHSYYRLTVTVVRSAFGPDLASFDAVAYNEGRTAESNRLTDAQAGRLELWSMRKGGDEWFVMTRWPVTALSRDPDAVQTSRALALPTKWTELVDVLEEAHEQHDTLCTEPGDALFNDNRRMSDEEFDQVLQTNLRSVFVACRASLRTMMRGKWGRIINVGSVAGLVGNVGQANYAAAKAGVVGFTKAVAKESGRDDLIVWPGTCIVHEQFSAKGLAQLKMRHPEAEVLAHPDIVDRLHARLVETLKAEAKAAADKARRRRR